MVIALRPSCDTEQLHTWNSQFTMCSVREYGVACVGLLNLVTRPYSKSCASCCATVTPFAPVPRP